MLQVPQRPPAMHLGLFFEVVSRGGRRCGPFQGPCVPWIVACDFTAPVRNEEVVCKDQDRYSLNHSSDGDDQIEKVPTAVRLIGVDRPWHPQKTEKVHGIERDMEANRKEPEMPFAERLVHQSPGGFGVPVIDACEDTEDNGTDQHIMKMCDHEIRVMELPVPRGHREHDSSQTRDQ